MLMLRIDPNAKDFVEHFGLDPNASYYRIINGERGAVQLDHSSYKEPDVFEVGIINGPSGLTTMQAPRKAPQSTPSAIDFTKETAEAATLVKDAQAICQAVAPPNGAQKADGLELLKSSSDPIMRQNADIALKILRGEPIK